MLSWLASIMQTAGNSKLLFAAAGFLAGVVFIGGIFYFLLNRDSLPSLSDITGKKTFDLRLTEAPDDGASVSSSKVTIKGTTGTEAVVVINGGAEDTIVQTAGGEFEVSYTLIEGENDVSITAFDQNTAETKTTTRAILYLTDLENL